MTLLRITFYFLIVMVHVSCIQNEPVKNINKSQTKIRVKQNKLVIYVQPFDDLPEEYLDSVIRKMKGVYPHVVTEPPIKLPLTALNQSGTRYRADSLIRFLRDRRDGLKSECVVIGLTTKDISVTRGRSSDHCVMGLCYRPGRACVVSLYRLKKSNRATNYFKLAMHELGHTQSLRHCSTSTCLMKATKDDHFDQMTDFCPKCKRKLNKVGWTLK